MPSPKKPRKAKDKLVTLTELARILDKSSQVISNWRRRYQDFPQPIIEDSESPLYDLTAVQNWQAARMLDKSAYRSNQNDFSREYYVAILLQLAYKKVGATSSSPWEDALKLEADMPSNILAIVKSLSINLQTPMSELWDRIRTFADLDQIDSLKGDLYKVINSKSIMAGAISNLELVDLIKELHSDQMTPIKIYDPAAGLSHGLLNFNYSKSTQLFGQEIDLSTADLAQLLAWITDQELTIVVGDTLQQDLLVDVKADLVICEPPFGMRTEPHLRRKDWPFGDVGANADLAWLQIVVEHLTDHGAGYMLLPSGALSRTAKEEVQIRRKLVSSDCLEAVIALPPISSATRLPVSLVVVRAPGARPNADGALMIDISDQKSWNLKSVIQISKHLHDFRKGKEVNIPGIAYVAKTRELMDDQVSWVPALYLARSLSNGTHRTLEISGSQELHHLEKNVLKMQLQVNEITSKASVIRFTDEQTTLGDLDRKNLINIIPGSRRFNPGGGNSFHETSAADTIEVISAADIRRSGKLIATKSIRTKELPNPTISKPNDILVARVGELTAKIDIDGGHVILAPVQIIRVTKKIDPNIIVSALNSSLARKLSIGSGIGRIEIEHIPLPAQVSTEDSSLAELMISLNILQNASDEISHLVKNLIQRVNETISNSYASIDDHAIPETGERN
jgi:type I restriction-modification system DNA methylase subunit/transposase-like protein